MVRSLSATSFLLLATGCMAGAVGGCAHGELAKRIGALELTVAGIAVRDVSAGVATTEIESGGGDVWNTDVWINRAMILGGLFIGWRYMRLTLRKLNGG